VPQSWDDRAYLRGTQYKTDANLAARQSIYAYQHPRIDLAALVIDLAGPGPSDTIVDVGCGNGMYLAELARRAFTGRALGIDLSLGMLAAARDRLAGSQDAPARPRSRAVALAGGDATALPLPDGVADLAFALHMLYHVPDPADALRELRRVTRPGGRVLVVLNGEGHMRELRAAVAAATGDPSAAGGEGFMLDDGESLARSFFPRVTRHDFTAQLRVPGPGPITDYVRSLSGPGRDPAAEHVAQRVAASFPVTSDGHYVISCHSGCLIGEVG
jgi:ubiquinone/menaquinone biosynthesis C-methylase UbiE